MPNPDIARRDELVARLSVNQLKQAKLARELQRSLALQDAVPDVFEGTGTVSSCATATYRLRVTTASGEVIELSLFDLPDILWPEAVRTEFDALPPWRQAKARKKAAVA